jgi:hypothetical protein
LRRRVSRKSQTATLMLLPTAPNLSVVIAGLDPAIHQTKEDGMRGYADKCTQSAQA